MPTAREIISPAPRCIGEDDTLLEAARLMRRHLRRRPLIDELRVTRLTD